MSERRSRDLVGWFRAQAAWRRAVLLRRAVAAALALLAVVLAVRPAGTGTTDVVVVARDVAPGSVLTVADLAVRGWPSEIVPAGVVGAVDAAAGRVAAGALRTGEPVTDLRLAGPALAAAATGIADAAAVPVRLADPDVAALLTPGTRVDVITGGGAVLAESAVVLTVLDPATGPPGSAARGRSALVALPRERATRVAAASLSEEVAVTLRSHS
ncbi:SAF domain-containing protein [Pseudonocardia oroxyli]|uniref:Flp pilus assembly protein CpaB n=1 Tax=Pseudonocardia oroxyli TaxID=366584 RepID=A0A1G7RYJ3_PSEOR|nr:SAF domain-containing protein [Pseudonocardia oroxyli]SDG15811.1 Flp pilus assembly protein CpaB [Pseudonocardia oroxyli]